MREIVRELPRHGIYQQFYWSPDGQWFCGVANTRMMRWRFSPKDAKTYSYTIRSNVPALEGKSGKLTSLRPPPDAAQGPHLGARTVSEWREDFLRDFTARMDRCTPP